MGIVRNYLEPVLFIGGPRDGHMEMLPRGKVPHHYRAPVRRPMPIAPAPGADARIDFADARIDFVEYRHHDWGWASAMIVEGMTDYKAMGRVLGHYATTPPAYLVRSQKAPHVCGVWAARDIDHLRRALRLFCEGVDDLEYRPIGADLLLNTGISDDEGVISAVAVATSPFDTMPSGGWRRVEDAQA